MTEEIDFRLLPLSNSGTSVSNYKVTKEVSCSTDVVNSSIYGHRLDEFNFKK